MTDRSWLRWLALAAAGTALAAAGCSSSEAPEASTTTTAAPATSAPGDADADAPDGDDADADGDETASAYCDAIDSSGLRELDQEVDPTDDASLDAYLDAVAEVVAAAPDEIADDWETVQATVEDIAAIDAADREDAMLELIGDAQLLDAQEAIDAYTLDACGETVGGDTGSGGTDDTMDDDEGATTDALQAYLDQNYEGETWIEDISSWSIVTMGGSIDVEVGTSEAWTVDQGIAACEAIAGWLFGLTDDGSITVSAGDSPIAVQASAADACEAA